MISAASFLLRVAAGLLMTTAGSGCVAVRGGRILARDMTQALPAFASLAPDLALGNAPAPGSRRTYSSAELARLAGRYGLAVAPGLEVCFVRPQEVLNEERVLAAMTETMPGARIQVVEFSRQPVPPGEVRFLLAGLGAGAQGGQPQLWRGAVLAHPDFPVWAKVHILVHGKCTVAAELLPAGQPIRAGQLREEDYEGPPGGLPLALVAGRMARRAIPAGTAILPQWLDAPVDVTRGARVLIEIRSGGARVRLEGDAQTAGRTGDVIRVRNSSNGKILQATVSGPGRVVIATSGEY